MPNELLTIPVCLAGNTLREPNYCIILDPGTGSVEDYASTGPGVPERVWHQRVLVFHVCPDVVTPKLLQCLEQPATQALVDSLMGLYQGEERHRGALVGVWPRGEYGEPAEQMEELVLQLNDRLTDLPAYTLAADIVEMEWSMLTSSSWASLLGEVLEDLQLNGYWVRAKDLSDHMRDWLVEEYLVLLSDVDRSTEDQALVELGRKLLSTVSA